MKVSASEKSSSPGKVPSAGHIGSQFLGVVSKAAGSGDLGGVAADPKSVAGSVSVIRVSEIASLETESGQKAVHSTPIRSIKGGRLEGLGGLGVLLADGTFLSGGGTPDMRGGSGNLKRFKDLSGVEIKKISAGKDHILLLDKEGRVYSMLAAGGDNRGQLGREEDRGNTEPVAIPGIPKIQSIQAGKFSTCLIDGDGGLWVCGQGNGWFPFQNKFEKPTKIRDGVQKAFSGSNSFATFILADGKVLAGGRNNYGQCGVGFTNKKPDTLSAWTEIKFDGEEEAKSVFEGSKLRKVSCSGGASFLLLEDGTLYSCGKQSECGFESQRTVFTKVATFSERGEKVLDFSCNLSITAFLTDSGRIYLARHGNRGRVRNALGPFNTKAVGSQGETFLEVQWKDESEREGLERMIKDEGKTFKVSTWKGDGNIDVFITERLE